VSANAIAPVFLDTSVLVTALESSIPNYQASATFCQQLVEQGSRVVISQVVRIEFAQAWFRLPANPYLKPETVRQYRLGAWDRNATVREAWLTFGLASLDQLLSRFADLIEVPLNQPIIAAVVPLMARYRLRSLDAVHVATAISTGIVDVASVDEDFRRVPNIRLTLLRDTPPSSSP
jgi:predicted nucleic acid-binding protein